MQPTQGYASGAITTQNLNPNSGVPTPGSFVALPLTAIYDTIALQVVGTYTGVLSLQGTVDGVNWITFGGAQALTNLNTAVQSANIASATQGIFQADVASFQAVRLTALAAVTGTATVSIGGTSANGMTGLDTPVTIAGGLTIGTLPSGTGANLTAAATTNATSVKATAGNLFELTLDNFSAAPKFFKLYNKASAPTVGTDVPVLTVEVAANASRTIEFGNIGKRLATGIAYALTGAQAVADTTALAAGDMHVSLTYI
jgi:hypothetical protein